MIGYTTIGTNDFKASVLFYDELMAVAGLKRLWSTDTMAAWGKSRNEPAFCVSKPFDGAPATVGNGTMIALKMDSSELVEAMHSKALELGGKSEGALGPRGTNGFFAGYFRDLDGNKLNAYIPARHV